MKTKRLLMLMFASAALLFASCEKEKSIEVRFPGREYTHSEGVYGGTEYELKFIFLVDNYHGPYFRTEINYGPGVYHGAGYSNDVAIVGNVSSFSDISVVPANWSMEVPVQEGYGYVFRSIYNGGNGHYIYWKLYVKEFVKDSAGNILAVKYILSEEWKL